MLSGTTTSLIAACILAVPAISPAQQGRPSQRMATMDRNGDGVVTRQEWTGTGNAFDARDWNGDGILSGDEMQPGARRGQARRSRQGGDGADGRNDEQFEDWTAESFSRQDRNRDGRITQAEWRFARDAFDRADHNGDRVVTRAEFLNEDTTAARDSVSFMDANRDGQVARREWRGAAEEFNRRDGNRDGVLSGTELTSVDGNLDSSRWRGQVGSGSQNRSQAYQAGFARGRSEGLEAGRQDRERNQGWDLEGQRELESADSGYTSSVGSRPEYQAGYREAFQAGYREGFGR